MLLILFAAIQHQQKFQLLDIQNQNLQQENTHLHILFSHSASSTVTTLSYDSANGYTKIGVLECQKKRKNKHYHNNECQHCTPLYIQQVGQPGYIVDWIKHILLLIITYLVQIKTFLYDQYNRK